jgi:hypothetical protein
MVVTPTLIALYAIAIAFMAVYRISRETHAANLEKLARADASNTKV